jgi:hypothetical protein
MEHLDETAAVISAAKVTGTAALVALSLLVLIVAHIGERLSFGSRTLGAVMTALLFAVGFAVWSYGVDDAVNQAVAMVSGGPEGR